MFQFNLAVAKEREGNGDLYQCDRCYPTVRHVSGRSRSFVAAINHAAASINEENRLDRSRAQSNLEAANDRGPGSGTARHDRDKGECLYSVRFQLLRGASLRLGRIELGDSIMIPATEGKRICPTSDPVSSRPS